MHIFGLLLRWAVALALCGHRRAAPSTAASFGGGAEAPLGLRLVWDNSLWVVGVELLHDALMATLPRAGYRAADPSTASLCTARVEDGRLYLGYRSIGRRDAFGDESPEEWSAPPIDPIGFAVPEVLALGDRLLKTGDYAAALAIYTLAGQAVGLAEMMAVRRRQVLLARDPGLDRRRVRRVVNGEHRTLQHVGSLLGEQAGELRCLACLQSQDAVAVQPVSHSDALTKIVLGLFNLDPGTGLAQGWRR